MQKPENIRNPTRPEIFGFPQVWPEKPEILLSETREDPDPNFWVWVFSRVFGFWSNFNTLTWHNVFYNRNVFLDLFGSGSGNMKSENLKPAPPCACFHGYFSRVLSLKRIWVDAKYVLMSVRLWNFKAFCPRINMLKGNFDTD